MKWTVRIVMALIIVTSLAGTALAEKARPVDGRHAATRFRVTVINMTPGQPFSPALIVAHHDQLDLFEPGTAASEGLALIAEEGDTSMMLTNLMTLNEVHQAVVAGDKPFFLGSSVSTEIEAPWPFDQITILGMLGSTNDAFYGLDSYDLTPWGRQEILIPAYDAGSEHNSEDCDFIPGPPCGAGGVRDTEGAEGLISISNGINGIGDLYPSTLGWENPVAKIIIEPLH